MTATTAPSSRQQALIARLDQLRAELEQARSELVTDSGGDAADRATNVDANIRFAMLEQRIAALEAELLSTRTGRRGEGVAVGDVVTVDLGDGPEPFLFGSVEQAADGLEAITPGSPLGRAIDGATVGTTVTYTAASRRTLTARIIAIS